MTTNPVPIPHSGCCYICNDPAPQWGGIPANCQLYGGKDEPTPAAQVASGEMKAEQCRRCGHANPSWSAPSPLWNAVMRGGSINGDPLFEDMVCASCFVSLAEQAGIASDWRLEAREVHVPLETVTPSGRIWDEKQSLWVEPAKPRDPVGEDDQELIDGILWTADPANGRCGMTLESDDVERLARLLAKAEAGHNALVEEIVTWLRDDAGKTRADLARMHSLRTLTIAQTAEWETLISLKAGIADAIERGDYRSTLTAKDA